MYLGDVRQLLIMETTGQTINNKASQLSLIVYVNYFRINQRSCQTDRNIRFICNYKLSPLNFNPCKVTQCKVKLVHLLLGWTLLYLFRVLPSSAQLCFFLLPTPFLLAIPFTIIFQSSVNIKPNGKTQ